MVDRLNRLLFVVVVLGVNPIYKRPYQLCLAKLEPDHDNYE